MIDWDDRTYPFTGFGDDPDTSIKFMLVKRESDDELAWAGGDAKLTTHAIHNSSDEVVQYHGRGPLTFTTRLWFRDADDLEAMWAVVGRAATLRYRWRLTTRAGGVKETRGSRDYLVLPNTTLVSLGGIQTAPWHMPEATATFRRAVGAASYYGFAQYTEE